MKQSKRMFTAVLSAQITISLCSFAAAQEVQKTEPEWTYGVTPHYQLIKKYFIDLPRNVSLSGKLGSKGHDEWQTWGFLTDFEPVFSIGIWNRGPDNKSTYSIRAVIKDLAVFQSSALTLKKRKATLELASGKADILPFTYVWEDIKKACLGYQFTDSATNLYIRGYFCGEDSEVPKNEALACILSSIAFDGGDPPKPKQSCEARTVFAKGY